MAITDDLLDQVNYKIDDLNTIAALGNAHPDDLAAIRDPDNRPDLSDNDDLRELAELYDKAISDGLIDEDGLDDPIGSYMNNSVLDINYSMHSDGSFRGSELTLAIGGPGVFFDTRTGDVDGYWGGEHVSRSVDQATVDAFDERCAEMFEDIQPRVDWDAYRAGPAVSIMSQATAASTMQGAVNASAGVAASAPPVAVVAPTIAPVRGM